MASRRDFIKGSVAAAAAAAMGSASQAFAGTQAFPGIIYTKENPGKWAGKAGSHAPKVKIKGGKVEVFTKHGMSKAHFIVRHSVVLEDGMVAGTATFYPSDEKAISIHELPKGYRGKVYVTSFCNLHDLWLVETKV